MNVSVIHNSECPLGSLMRDELAGAGRFRVASAFLNSGGLRIVLPSIQNILANEGEVQILHGADFRVTDPDAIDALVSLKDRHPHMRYRVHYGWDLVQSHRFHPKLYIWSADYQNYTVVVGSSNLTLGGLTTNLEVNTVMRGSLVDPAIERSVSIFNNMFNLPGLIEPDLRFAEIYRKLYEHARELPIEPEPLDDELLELYRELEDLIEGSKDDWEPRTQLEFVVKAIQNLEAQPPDPNLLADASEEFVHLKSIYTEFERLARDAGKIYDWSAIETSVRGRINANIGNPPKPSSYFVRAGGMSGLYRLSQAGRDFIQERNFMQSTE